MLLQNAIIICDQHNLIVEIEALCLDKNKQKIIGNNANNFIKNNQGYSAKITQLLCSKILINNGAKINHWMFRGQIYTSTYV